MVGGARGKGSGEDGDNQDSTTRLGPGQGSDHTAWTGQPVVAHSQPRHTREIAESLAGGRLTPVLQHFYLPVRFYDVVAM